jgi:isocitrate dehydrogenase
MGELIKLAPGGLDVPLTPVIPYIEGDGTGPDIWRAAKFVVDEAVRRTYGGARRIEWKEILAGDKAHKQTGGWLPKETIDAIKKHVVAIKGPLTTPVGKGFRSLNVTLRQALELYACVRPIKWIEGVPSPVKNPERVNMIVFRENTEDIYAGLEWMASSREAEMLRAFIRDKLKKTIPKDAGIGIKTISKTATERIMRKALEYAISNGRKTVTIVHKGNIMKYTEGSFMEWCYSVAQNEYCDRIVMEKDLSAGHDSVNIAPRLLINDRIADNMFQQILVRSNEYDVLVMPNLNGDYFSDALSAQVGGLGMAPGANIGDGTAVFEATHGTAPKYAGMDKVNPGSLILSASMMLEYIGWREASALIDKSLHETIKQKRVTYDLARQMEGATELKTSEFAEAIVENMAYTECVGC